MSHAAIEGRKIEFYSYPMFAVDRFGIFEFNLWSCRILLLPLSRFLAPPSSLLLLIKTSNLSFFLQTGLTPSALRCFSSGGSQPFLLADIGEGIAEVELLQWFVNVGDDVKQFDKICEVQSDKATVEITSRYDGVVESLNGDVGDMMIVGEPLMMIAVEGGVAGGAGAGGGGEKKVTTDEPGEMKTKLNIPSSAGGSGGGGFKAGDGSKVLTTPAVRKMGKEHNIDLSTVEGTGPNGRILKEDILRLIGGGGGGGGGNFVASPAKAVPVSSSPPSALSAAPSEPKR